MIKVLQPIAKRAATGSISLLLRLASLIGKLALSIFMGRFFPLAELGLYGLAFGAVMLAIVLFGFRVDYVVTREILGMDRQMQRQVGSAVAALYLVSFALAAPFALAALMVEGAGRGLYFVLLIYVLCGVEAYANFLYTATIALKRPALANALFFIRSGLWTVPAMVVSYLYPAYRTVDAIILFWLAGSSASVTLNAWFMRHLLFARTAWRSLPWKEVRSFIRGAALVWVGSVGLTLGVYLDRFLLASFLTLEDVGVATFYTSFTVAVLTLVQSATTSITFPKMIDHFDSGEFGAYRAELGRTALLAAGLSLLILMGLAATMYWLAPFMGKPEFLTAYGVFLLLLIATFVRTHGETLYYGLFVERQHKAIWLGNLIFLAASFLFNLALIPTFGLVGLGYAALLSAALITGWRAWTLRAAACAT